MNCHYKNIFYDTSLVNFGKKVTNINENVMISFPHTSKLNQNVLFKALCCTCVIIFSHCQTYENEGTANGSTQE